MSFVNRRTPLRRAPSFFHDFRGGSLPKGATMSRASAMTDGFWSDATGSSINSFATDVPAFRGGLLMFRSATNRLINAATPATQTTGSLNAATYTLWVVGSGSATSSAGTATGTGFGVATAGSPNTFTLTGSGTVTVTVSGSLTRFQLESGTLPTPFVETAGAVATRATGTCYMPWTVPGQEFTMLARATLPYAATFTSSRGLFSLSTGSTTNGRLRNAANVTTISFSNGGGSGVPSATTNSAFGAVTAGSQFSAGGMFAAGRAFVAAISPWSGDITSSSTNTTPSTTVDTMCFGCEENPATNSASGILHSVAFWPRRVPLEQLVGFAQDVWGNG